MSHESAARSSGAEGRLTPRVPRGVRRTSGLPQGAGEPANRAGVPPVRTGAVRRTTACDRHLAERLGMGSPAGAGSGGVRTTN
ncbi:hypothetical protein WJ16_14125 [Burkholderia metallica]|nr:hypothetical protein WJ16_14125 [Burkholderia metallica]